MDKHPSGRAFAPTIRQLVLAISLCTPALSAMAAEATVTERRSYQIPTSTLADALNRFAADAGVELVFNPREVPSRSAPAMRGNYTVQEGFERLLTGSGLRAVQKPDGSWTLAKEPDNAAVLSAVKVRSTTLDATTEGTGSFTSAAPVTAGAGLKLSLRETPQSITLITRARIEQQNLTSLADVVEQVPGVYYNAIGTPIGGRHDLMARGYEVSTYRIDDVTMPWSAIGESQYLGQGALDMAIYDSVAVVRGATGLMTGAGDPSASINLTRKRPTQEFKGYVAASAGSWDRRRLEADVGAPLTEAGNVRGRAVAVHDEGDTWVDRYSSDRDLFYGVIETDLGARTLLTVALEHGRDSSKGAPWGFGYGETLFYADGTPTEPTRSGNASPQWARSESDRTNISAALEHHFNEVWQARVTYAYGELDSEARRGMVWDVLQDGTPMAARVLNIDMTNKVHVVDAKLEGQYTVLNRQHDLVVGANLSYVDTHYHSSHYSEPEDFARWINGVTVYDDLDWDALDKQPSQTDTDQHGAYLATRLRPADRFSIILGGRISYWKTRSADLDPYNEWENRRYSDEYTPYAGLVFDINRMLTAYASYTETFVPQSSKDVNGKLLDPEEGKNYEFGLKGEWFDGQLNASVAAFETRKDNLAVPDGNNTTPEGDEAYRAESSTKGRGWEIEVAGEIARGWQLQAGYTRFLLRDSEDRPLNTYLPRHQLKLFTSYQPALAPKLTVGGGIFWQSETYDINSDEAYREISDIDAYMLVNLNAHYEISEQLSLALNLNNALNEDQRTNLYSHSYGPPRNLFATVKYQF